MVLRSDYDVVVLGAGNAALTAALSAHEAGASVLVLEKAPYEFRGGNSQYTTGVFRIAYPTVEDLRSLVPDIPAAEWEAIDIQHYRPEDFHNDLMKVTEGLADPTMTQLLVEEGYPAVAWMRDQGVRWELAVQQHLRRNERPRASMVRTPGAGLGLMDMLFDIVEQRGIPIVYQAGGQRLLVDSRGKVEGVVAKDPEGIHEIAARSVVLACGGFEANVEMRVRYMGPQWNTVKVRGTRYNTGEGVKMALDIGAQPFGHWPGAHAVPMDINSPEYGSLELTDHTRRIMHPYCIMVNVNVERFADEGEDWYTLTYAKMGDFIQNQPQRLAFQIFDAKSEPIEAIPQERDYYGLSLSTPARADTIEELADKLGLDREALVRQVEEFNQAVDEETPFDPTILDGKSTRGLKQVKSNWAQKIDTPPFVAYPVTGGITFTYGGLKINTRGQVLDTSEQVIPGLYAAGELTGGFFYYNYPGGAGLTRGAVTGRLAGRSAVEDS